LTCPRLELDKDYFVILELHSIYRLAEKLEVAWVPGVRCHKGYPAGIRNQLLSL